MIFYLDPVNGIDDVQDLANPARQQSTVGGASVVGTYTKHGTNCLDLVNGNFSAGLRVPADAGVRFGAGQFTVEATVVFASHNSTAIEPIINAADMLGGGDIGWAFGMTVAGKLAFMYTTDGSTRIEVAADYSPPLDTILELAVDRDASNVVRVYVNGDVIASATVAATIFASTSRTTIGNRGNETNKFPGYILGIRVTKGYTRYGGAYTPSAGAWGQNSTDDAAWAFVTMLFVFLQAGDGTSFVNRARTLDKGLSSGHKWYPFWNGDEIRIIRSPAPTSVGNAAWVSGNRALTLAAAVTQTIDSCDTAWTAAAGVTATAATTGRKQGSAYANLVVSNVNGKIAHRTLPVALDLSTYQQVSAWFRASSAIASGSVELRLCSDTTGDVPVKVIPLDMPATANSWRVLWKDFKASLGGSIGSVALYSTVAISTTIRLDNIIACLPSTNPAALTHLSGIGKRTTAEPEWYPILSIDGTTVTLGGANTVTVDDYVNQPYVGTSETVETYRLQPLNLIAGQSATWTPASFRGASGLPVVWSGGWDTFDMSTKIGETWLSGAHHVPNALQFNFEFNELSNVGLMHFTGSVFTMTGTQAYANKIELLGMVGCAGLDLTFFNQSLYLDLGNVVSCSPYGVRSIAAINGDLLLKARRITGCHNSLSGFGLKLGAYNNRHHRVYVDSFDNNDGQGAYVEQNYGRVTFYKPAFNGNRAYGFYQGVLGGDVTLMTPTYSNSGFGGYVPASGDSWNNDVLHTHAYNGDVNDNRSEAGGWSVKSDTTKVHAASGYSWKFTANGGSVANKVRPFTYPIARIDVTAGVPITINCWAQRADTSVNAGIMVRAGSVQGVDIDVKTAITFGTGAWEPIGIAITPTQDGVVELLGWVESGTAWFNEISVI